MEIYYEPRNEAAKKVSEIASKTEMSEFESAFLCGLIKENRPNKIVEVGVAAGGTTAIILQCMDLLGLRESKLYSVDLNEKYYQEKNTKTNTGYLAEKIKPKIDFINHEYLLGKILPERMSQIGGGY